MDLKNQCAFKLDGRSQQDRRRREFAERGEDRRPLFRDEGRPIFQISALDPTIVSCALRHASTIASIVEHKPGL